MQIAIGGGVLQTGIVRFILMEFLGIGKVFLKKVFLVIYWLMIAGFSFGQSNFTKGEDRLMQNKPSEALVFLENAVADEPSNVKAYLYLGIVYEQLGKSSEAIAVYKRVLPIAGNLSANVANNLGNVYFLIGDMTAAEQFYTQAIDFDSSFSKAWLGRANTRLKAGKLREAAADYEQYLLMVNNSSQRTKIEQLVNLIRAEAAAEERKKLLAEEEERVRAEERQRLLDEVSASLQSAADGSQGISSGAESVEGYDGEFELQ